MGINKYEVFKTVLLFILVVASIFLTWGLWTYQLTYNETDDENTSYIQDITISPKRELVDHVRPTQLLYHDGVKHFGSTKEEEITKWLNEMENWHFYNIHNISDDISKGEFLSFVHGSETMEIIYPDAIPIQTFQLMFNVDEEVLSSSIYFDRIIVKTKKGQNQAMNAYLVDYEAKKVYETSLENVNLGSVNRLNAQVESKYEHYISYNLNDTRSLFLPQKQIEMNYIQYYTGKIEAEKFRNILFSDPRLVTQETQPYGDLYTDGARLLEIYSLTNVMDYVDPMNDNSQEMDINNLIKRSFNFVNDHGGWTEETYRFVRWDRMEQEVVYQLFENNYPVFNNQHMAEVYQRWGNAEIARYRRPIYRIIKLALEVRPVTLPSGSEIIERIKNNPNKLLLKNVVIGYELKRESSDSKVISLQPGWFYLYNGKWEKIEEKQELGD